HSLPHPYAVRADRVTLGRKRFRLDGPWGQDRQASVPDDRDLRHVGNRPPDCPGEPGRARRKDAWNPAGIHAVEPYRLRIRTMSEDVLAGGADDRKTISSPAARIGGDLKRKPG